jgi:hypothetical protein
MERRYAKSRAKPSSDSTFAVLTVVCTPASLAGAFHLQTGTGDLYLNFGSPSAIITLDRTI